MYQRGDFVHIWAMGYWAQKDLVGRVGRIVDAHWYIVEAAPWPTDDDESREFLTVETVPHTYYRAGELFWDEYLPEHLGPPIPGDDLSPWLIAELTK